MATRPDGRRAGATKRGVTVFDSDSDSLSGAAKVQVPETGSAPS